MTFVPVIPSAGISGWQFLQRTYESQFETFNKAPSVQRDVEVFRDKISDISSVEGLLEDRQVLRVALGAFGLQDDINNTFFLRRILEDGTASDDALSNRLADERYKRLSDAFGFGPNQILGTNTAGFADKIIAQFQTQSFEIAVGQQDEDIRIALNADRELAIIGQSGKSDRAQWFTMMGLPPLRALFETALGLPQSFGQLDIDKQFDTLREKSQKAFGTSTLSDFTDPDLQQQLVNAYLARAQINALSNTSSGASIALTLLQTASQ